ncbi:MAG TPA: hypothetical protein VMY99_00945 [Nevskiaceae bacterium]|nr:hypothetical protein [Nevskiaceae bacterium]
MPKIAKKPNYMRGALFALGGPVAGIAVWVALWEMGFIASIATFLMAWLTIWLYRKGAGTIDRRSLYVILPYIFVGIALSILAGMIDDSLHYVTDEVNKMRHISMLEILFKSAFWSFTFDNLLHNGELWAGYTKDILISLGLGALGAYSTVRDVLEHGNTSGPGKAKA